MAKGEWLSPYQQGIVRRYYEHKQTLMTQKLGEIVSELAVCGEPKRRAALWRSARAALLGAGVHPGKVERLVERQDVEELARVVAEIF